MRRRKAISTISYVYGDGRMANPRDMTINFLSPRGTSCWKKNVCPFERRVTLHCILVDAESSTEERLSSSAGPLASIATAGWASIRSDWKCAHRLYCCALLLGSTDGLEKNPAWRGDAQSDWMRLITISDALMNQRSRLAGQQQTRRRCIEGTCGWRGLAEEDRSKPVSSWHRHNWALLTVQIRRTASSFDCHDVAARVSSPVLKRKS